MKKSLLLPRLCRPIGCVLFPLGLAWLISFYVFDHSIFPFLKFDSNLGSHRIGPSSFLFEKDFYTDFNGELSILVTLISLFMIAFTREKIEDEYVSLNRLKAMQLSLYLNLFLVAVASIFIYGFAYVYVLQCSIYSILVIYILVFVYQMHIKTLLSKSDTL